MSPPRTWSEEMIQGLTEASRGPLVSNIPPRDGLSQTRNTPRYTLQQGELAHSRSYSSLRNVDTALVVSQAFCKELPSSIQDVRDRGRISVDYDNMPLPAFVKYDPRATSLGEYLRRVASFPETFGLRFKDEVRLRRNVGSPTTANQVLHDLHVLERMYRPGNVTPPSMALIPSLNMLHYTLEGIKKQLEEGFLEIQQMRRTLHSNPSDFIAWAYNRHPMHIGGSKTRKYFFRRHRDSPHSGDIEEAISYYSSAEAVNDKTPAGIMADILVNVLEEFLAVHLSTRKPLLLRLWCRLREIKFKRREEPVTMDNNVRAIRPEDRFLFKFPEVV